MFTQISTDLYTCRGQNSRYVLTYGNISGAAILPWTGWRLDCIEHGVSFRIAAFITDTRAEDCSLSPFQENFTGSTMHEILKRATEMVKHYEYAGKVSDYL